MLNFAFVSRHNPTPEQNALALEYNVQLIPIGDRDAFTINPEDIDAMGVFDGVVVVHPAAALRLVKSFLVGIFENGTRPADGDKPTFFATAFHIYS